MVAEWQKVIEDVNEFLHWFTNFWGGLANIWLMYVIIRKTPENLKPYAVLIFNFALTDGIACIAGFFVMQRIIPFGMHLAYISYGPCQRLGPTACYIGYCFQLHCYAHTLNSMVISFAYRLHILKRPPPAPIIMAFIVFILYLPSLAQAVTFIFAMDPHDKVREMVAHNFPQYNLTGLTVTGHLDIQNFWSLYTIFYLTLPCVPVYVTVMIIRRKIYTTLSTAEMSEKTRQTHLKLVRALTYQAILPVVFVIGVVSYALEQLNIYHNIIFELTVFQALGAVPVLSPYLSLYFVGPYQRATLEMLGRLGFVTKKLKSLKSRRISAATKSHTANTTTMTQPSVVSNSAPDDANYA